MGLKWAKAHVVPTCISIPLLPRPHSSKWIGTRLHLILIWTESTIGFGIEKFKPFPTLFCALISLPPDLWSVLFLDHRSLFLSISSFCLLADLPDVLHKAIAHSHPSFRRWPYRNTRAHLCLCCIYACLCTFFFFSCITFSSHIVGILGLELAGTCSVWSYRYDQLCIFDDKFQNFPCRPFTGTAFLHCSAVCFKKISNPHFYLEKQLMFFILFIGNYNVFSCFNSAKFSGHDWGCCSSLSHILLRAHQFPVCSSSS